MKGGAQPVCVCISEATYNLIPPLLLNLLLTKPIAFPQQQAVIGPNSPATPSHNKKAAGLTETETINQVLAAWLLKCSLGPERAGNKGAAENPWHKQCSQL